MKSIAHIYGPYVRMVDARKIVVIHYIDGTTKTTSYARHIYEQHHNIELDSNVDVDHINGDASDDRIENLQLLSRSDNVLKQYKDSGNYRLLYIFECPVCETKTQKEFNQVKHNWNLGKSGPFCSRKCGGFFTNIEGPNTTKEFREKIYGRMLKSADKTVLKTVGYIDRAGSSPATPTNLI